MLRKPARILSLILSFIVLSPTIYLAAAQAQQAKAPPAGSAKSPSLSNAGNVAPASKTQNAPANANAGSQTALPPETPNASQAREPDTVVATVNGAKIYRSDIERELRRNGRTLANQDFTAEMRDRVLHDLITDLLVEQYLRENNRLQDVALEDAIHQTKNTAMAQHMLISLARKQKPVTEAEIAQFITEHPDFFQGRRAWDYVDIAIEKSPEIDMNKIRTLVDILNKKQKMQKKNQQEAEKKGLTEEEKKDQIIDEFAKITDMAMAKRLEFADFRGIKNSEEISTPVLEKLKTMSPGETAIDDGITDKFIHVIKLNSSFPSPVDPMRMRVGIVQGMVLERASVTMRQIMDQMRDSMNLKIVTDLSRNRVAEMKQAMQNVRENADTKIVSEYEKTQQVIKEMQELANKRVLAEAQRRKNRALNTNANERVDVESTKTSREILNENTRLAKNIWLLSLPVLFLAAFYQFLQKSNKRLKELTDRAAKDPRFEVESKLERFAHNKFITWAIGILLAYFLGKTGWHEFNVMNIYIVKKTLLEWSAIALVSSILLIWVISRIYSYLPALLREWRFLFLALITTIQIGIMAAG